MYYTELLYQRMKHKGQIVVSQEHVLATAKDRARALSHFVHHDVSGIQIFRMQNGGTPVVFKLVREFDLKGPTGRWIEV